MKSPHPPDPLDELIAAALHGELSPQERAHFDSRLENDPAARAAYQEAQAMHDLLEKTHQSAQPDAAFEQRMVSGVRRKIKDEDQPKETAWESVLVVWNGFFKLRLIGQSLLVFAVIGFLATVVIYGAGGTMQKAAKVKVTLPSVAEVDPDRAAAAQKLLAQGNSYYRDKQYDKAEETVSKVLALDPYNKKARDVMVSLEQRKEMSAGQRQQKYEQLAMLNVNQDWAEGISQDVVVPSVRERGARRELANTPGQLYDTVRAEASRKRLENLNSFQKVDVASKDMKQVLDEQGINYVATGQKGITLSGYVDTSTTRQFAGQSQPYQVGPAMNEATGNNGEVAASNAKPVTDPTMVGMGGLLDPASGEKARKGTQIVSGGLISQAGGEGAALEKNREVDFDGFIDYGVPIAKKLDEAEPVFRNPSPAPKSLVPHSIDGLLVAGETLSGAPTVTTQNGLATTVDVVKEFPAPMDAAKTYIQPSTATTPQGGSIVGGAFAKPAKEDFDSLSGPTVITKSGEQGVVEAVRVYPYPVAYDTPPAGKPKDPAPAKVESKMAQFTPEQVKTLAEAYKVQLAAEEAQPDPARKLIRNAVLDLEVKNYEAAIDDITTLTRAAGGYVDTSDSHKGGNGKLQGTVSVKVLPQKLESFLIKLRLLGTVANQSVSTNDVTKDYYDTEARLANARKMETQLQDLLKRTNGKVSELLQVEREIGRVRGEIEQMQGSLKFIDFQVQYATVKIEMKEKDLNQAAAYLLKEKDNFSLFATDVEATFQKARAVAEEFKAQVLQANLDHASGNSVSAELVVMVAPTEIEAFLTRIRDLGRVANFTRNTERVAQDGGDSDRPADQTLTEKDKVEVHLSIRSDDEMRKQVAVTVVTPAVDTAFDAAKKVALEQPGTTILASSLNRTPDGQATARLTVRVPGVAYPVLIEALGKLGRTASLSIQRNDNSGPGAKGDEAPVIVSLLLTDEEAPLQLTELSVLAANVDSAAQQLKREALAAGVEVKASNFARQADGTEMAQLVFRLSMGKNSAFLETLKKSGKVEMLTVQRSDQLREDETAPAAISLRLHNQRDIVPDNGGLWATLRQTFGEGAGALFGSIKTIGVILAFLAPWVVALGFLAWAGRRIYVWRKGRK